MKIATITAVYNNRQFIEPVLKSIENFSDKIIIMEGSWNPELPRRSTDGTFEFLNETYILPHAPCLHVGQLEIDGGPGLSKTIPNNKYTICYYNHSTKLDLPETNTYRPIVLANELKARQWAVDQIPEDFDWMMWIDSDEVYNPEDLQKLREYLEEFSNVDGCAFSFDMNSFVFYFNYNFGIKEKYNRVMSIKGRPKIGYTDRLSYNMPVVKETIPDDICFMYHYGYIGDNHVKTKMSMWDKKETDYWYNQVYIPMIKNQKVDLKNFHLFARKLGYGGTFEEFKGQHPKIIQEMIKC